MGILGFLAQLFVNAFGKALTEWLRDKRAEQAQRELGAAREREKGSAAAADSLRRQDQAAAKAPHSEAQVIEALNEGRF